MIAVPCSSSSGGSGSWTIRRRRASSTSSKQKLLVVAVAVAVVSSSCLFPPVLAIAAGDALPPLSSSSSSTSTTTSTNSTGAACSPLDATASTSTVSAGSSNDTKANNHTTRHEQQPTQTQTQIDSIPNHEQHSDSDWTATDPSFVKHANTYAYANANANAKPTTKTNSRTKIKTTKLVRNKNNNKNNNKLSFLTTRTSRGGGGSRTILAEADTTTTKATANTVASKTTTPSFYWAVLHNWLYFLSLGFNAVNIPYLIREVVDGPAPEFVGSDATRRRLPSARSIALSGNVEAVDKILTFGGIAYLSALSDKHGRKPMIVWSSLGFAITNLLQYLAGRGVNSNTSVNANANAYANSKQWSSTAILYLADFVDGCSSCMGPVCQAYVADCSPPSSLASNLGIFQGVSMGGAFVLAFPIGGIIGAKHGPKVAILMAAGFQLLNCFIAAVFTPESNANANAATKPTKTIRFSEVNPITGLQKLFGIGGGGATTALLRTASLTYFFLSLARGALDAQFINYTNVRFGWTQAQSGPVLVMVGLTLAIVPRLLVPRLGLQTSINLGLLVYALGLSGAGLVSTPSRFVLSIAVISFGCVAIPALQALLANLAPPGEAGALLGAVGSLSELTGAIGSSMYASLFATFATASLSRDEAKQQSFVLSSHRPGIPGMHFLVGASFCLIGWAISAPGLNRSRDHPALKTNGTSYGR